MFARELGVDLMQVRGSGAKGRITADDVRGFVKARHHGRRPSGRGAGGGRRGPGSQSAGWPNVDFAKFGQIERVEMSRIRKIAGRRCHATG